MEKEVIKSSIKTPDGTVLTSYYRHDFKIHKDKKTGKEYGIDGGTDYQRYIGDIDDCEIILIYSDDSFQNIRDNFTWGTFGINGDEKKSYLKLSEMSNNHIKTILNTQNHISYTTKNIFQQELEYRKDNYIFIKD